MSNLIPESTAITKSARQGCRIHIFPFCTKYAVEDGGAVQYLEKINKSRVNSIDNGAWKGYNDTEYWSNMPTLYLLVYCSH